MSASSPRRLLCAACLVGFLVSIAGLFIRSQAFLRFAGVRLSADGILDSYTVARAGTLAAKLFAAGLLIPLIAAAAPWLLRRTPAKRGEGVLAAMAIAALCLGFLWLVDIPPYQAAAMRSQPDEIQYTIPAINLLTRGRLVIVMNGLEFPPYTAIGFQLILVPFYRIFGTMIGNGIRAVQAGVILSLLGTYVLGTIVLGKKRGLLAALLLASNPCFIFWSRGIMPSTVTTMLTIVIALLTVAMARQAAFAHGAAGAALLGFITGAQICIAFSYVYVAPAVFIVMLYVLNEGRGRGEVAKHALLFGLAFCGALLPLLLYQHAAYGGFFTTGYDAWYWARPPGESPAIRFSLAPRPYDVFLLELIGKLGWDTSVNRIVVFILDLAGLGSLYNIATFLLILSGLRFAWTKAPATGYRVLLLFIGLFLAFTAAGYSFLLWAPTRYMLPIVPLVLLVCADGFYSGLEHAEGMGSCFRQLLLCSLLGFALLEGGGCAW
jgi:4-amino-4-deoxy-L-arabinose transferase-like glycosyltransferase